METSNNESPAASEARVKAYVVLNDTPQVEISDERDLVITSSQKNYSFDGVYDGNSEKLYGDVLQTLIPQVVEGFTITVFSTGEMHSEWPGSFAQQASAQLFGILSSKEEFSVRVSQLEIVGSNEHLHDLLSGGEERALRLFDHPKEGVTVHNLESFPCSSADAVSEHYERGAEKRAADSHQIFSITVNTKVSSDEGEEQLTVGRLNLVDISSNNTLALGRVITALLGGMQHVPYRESKLTRLLQESLGGTHKTCVIANVNEANHESMLEFASRAKNVRNKPRINSRVRKRAMVRELVSEVERLKKALQDAREKNGVYIPPEEWAEVQQEHANTKANLESTSQDLQKRVAQLEELHSQYEESQSALSSTRQRLASTESQLSSTQSTLMDTAETLQETQTRLSEREEIINVREAVETVLHSNAERVLGALEVREDEVERLHAKLAREAATKQVNEESAEAARIQVSDAVYGMGESLEQFRAEQNSRYSELRGDISEFLERKNAEMQRLCEALDSLEGAISKSSSALTADVTERKTNALHDLEEVVAAATEEREQVESCVDHYLAETLASLDSLRDALTEERSQLQTWVEQSIEAIERSSQQQQQWCEGHIGALQQMSNALQEQCDINTAWAETHSAKLQNSADAQQKQAQEGATQLMEKISGLLTSFVADMQQERSEATKSALADISNLDSILKEQTSARTADISESLVPSITQHQETQQASHASMVNSVQTRSAFVQQRIEEDLGRAEDWQQLNDTFGSDVEHRQSQGTRAVDAAHSVAVKQTTESASAINAALGEMVMEVAEWKEGAAEASLTAQAHTETVCESLSEQLQATSQHVGSWSQQTVGRINEVSNTWDAYFASRAEVEITGQTPKKRVIEYPTELPQTKPNDEIIAEYWNTHRKELGHAPFTPTSVAGAVVPQPNTAQLESKTKSVVVETPAFVSDPQELMAALGEQEKAEAEAEVVAEVVEEEKKEEKKKKRRSKSKTTSSKSRRSGSDKASSAAMRRAQKRGALKSVN